MGYRFKNNKNAGQQALAILVEQTRRAEASLDRYEQAPVESIHVARQCFKRARSLLHLLRDDVPYVFEVENHFFRMSGRVLSGARDEDAMRETFMTLSDLYSDRYPRELKLLEQSLHCLIKGAEVRRDVSEHQAVAEVLDGLQRAFARYEVIDLSAVKVESMLASLQFTLHTFRNRYREACVEDAEDAYHRWRKLTKRAQDQLKLCAAITGHDETDYRAGLRVLAQTLGYHQDMCVLRARLQMAGLPDKTAESRVLTMLERLQSEYRQLARDQMQALLRGEELPTRPLEVTQGQLRAV